MSPALIVGNPRMPLLTICGVQLRPRALAAAEESSRWLAARVRAEALAGEQATERRVRSDAGGARLIHLETHGFAYENEAGARASFVTLTSDSGATPRPEADGLYVFRVQADSAEYWDTPGGTVASLLSFAKSKVTGEPYQGTGRETVDL